MTTTDIVSLRGEELARHVLAFIKEHEHRWDQSWWFHGTPELDDPEWNKTAREGSCGTTACFAGWVGLLTGGVGGVGPDEEHPSDQAVRLLNITEDQGDVLFLATNGIRDIEAVINAIYSGHVDEFGHCPHCGADSPSEFTIDGYCMCVGRY